MDKLIAVLARWGTAELSALIGEETTRLLDALDAKNVGSHRLARLAVELNGPHAFVRAKAKRDRLLSALNETDAKHLLKWLGKPEASEQPWNALRQIHFTKSNDAGKVLRDFLQIPEEISANDSPESVPQRIIEPSYPLFDHQARASNEILELLNSAEPRALLHMPTGSGKTRTTMNVISALFRTSIHRNETVLWLAHSEELCEQAAQEFERAWRALGDHPLNIYRHFGPSRVEYGEVEHGLLVGSLSLLYLDSTRKQSDFLRFARRVRLVVMDEAHQAPAPTYSHLLNLLAPHSSTKLLGLTATPGRSWLDAGEDLKLASIFKAQKVGLKVEGFEDPVEFLQSEGYLSRTEYMQVPYKPGAEFTLTSAEQKALSASLDIPSSVVEKLATNEKRNLLILRRAMWEADRGGKIIVFACSVKHARMLANLLQIKGYEAGAIAGDTAKHERHRLISQFLDGDVQILTNYGVLTTGFDAPEANVAIITRPTQSVVLYTQMVGRVARGVRQGGTESCRIVTVVDDLPGFRSLSEGFNHWEDIWTDDIAKQLGLRRS